MRLPPSRSSALLYLQGMTKKNDIQNELAMVVVINSQRSYLDKCFERQSVTIDVSRHIEAPEPGRLPAIATAAAGPSRPPSRRHLTSVFTLTQCQDMGELSRQIGGDES